MFIIIKGVGKVIASNKPWKIDEIEWRSIQAGSVLEVVYRYPNFYGFEYVEKGVPILRGELIKNKGQVEPDISKYKKILPETSERYPKTILRSGDLAITVRGTLGKIAYITPAQEGWQISPNLIRVSPAKHKLFGKYLYYFFSHFFNSFIDSSAVIPRLKATTIRNLKIPLPFRNNQPDLETQKKIVEYIEANFERIDKILERKKRELTLLDELWGSILDGAFKPKEWEDWEEIPFLDKVSLLKGKNPNNILKQKTPLPYLTLEYFREGKIHGYIPTEETKILRVNKGDLVIVADGSRSGELFFCGRDGALVSTMAKLDINDDRISETYLFWFLNTYFEHLNKSKYTATPHVNRNFLKDLKIPLPFRNGEPDPIKQKEIAEYLDNVNQKIRALEEKIQNQINHLEELKESILHEVFRLGTSCELP